MPYDDTTQQTGDGTDRRVIEILSHGPYILRGKFELVDLDLEPIPHEGRVALCRCGASGEQPFCDGSAEWCEGAPPDAALPVAQDLRPAARIRVLPRGPFVVHDEVDIIDHEHGSRDVRSRVALCRCGASQIGPLCDGSHNDCDY